jgi:hypothetical protein
VIQQLSRRLVDSIEWSRDCTHLTAYDKQTIPYIYSESESEYCYRVVLRQKMHIPVPFLGVEWANVGRPSFELCTYCSHHEFSACSF